MNATSVDELRASSGAGAPKDETMDEVRELLLGDHAREVHARIGALEQRQRDFEAATARQLDAIAARIESLASETGEQSRSSFEALSRSVLELGERIRGLTIK